MCLAKQREGAQKVVVAAKRRQVWENAWWRSEQQFCLDLHLMSVGAAQAMLHVWLLDLRDLVWEGHDLPRVLRYVMLVTFGMVGFRVPWLCESLSFSRSFDLFRSLDRV